MMFARLMASCVILFCTAAAAAAQPAVFIVRPAERADALGISEPLTIGEGDYDNLFVVVRGTKPTLLRLHYR